MQLNIHYRWILKDSRFLTLRVHDGEVAPADRRRSKSGGKSPAERLLKPVKASGKRAAFLRWYVESPEPGRSIGAAMATFGMTRQNVIAYWTNIRRDHGIGYALENNTITPRFPRGVAPAAIFGVAP